MYAYLFVVFFFFLSWKPQNILREEEITNSRIESRLFKFMVRRKANFAHKWKFEIWLIQGVWFHGDQGNFVDIIEVKKIFWLPQGICLHRDKWNFDRIMNVNINLTASRHLFTLGPVKLHPYYWRFLPTVLVCKNWLTIQPYT